MSQTYRFDTRVVHSGRRQPLPNFYPTVPPIYLTTTFAYPEYRETDAVFFHQRDGYVYSRYGTPTHRALESAVADLEGGDVAFCTASGMAAVHLALLAAGVGRDVPVLLAQDVYGSSLTLATRVLARLGVPVYTVDVGDMTAVRRQLDTVRPGVVFFEVISNPLTKVADVPTLIEWAHAVGARVVVDNTFTTPFLFRPLEHGADFVVHSATKYLSGHGDVLAGVVVTRKEYASQVETLLRQVGSTLGPMEAWLVYRGLKTLALRFPRQCENAQRIATFLQTHPRVARVYYPGLSDHPDHERATHLFGGRYYGAIVAFEIAGAGQKEVFRFLDSLKLCLPVTTLGDIYTTVLYPARSSHHYLTDEEREALGIGLGLVRLSAGIENGEDLIEDLAHALAQVAS